MRLGVVLGERQLTTRGARPTAITVTLGTPTLPGGSEDWECPFRISGAGIRVNECGYGCDAIQSLQNALQGIRFFLDKSGKSFDWFGVPVEALAFPRAIPAYGDVRLTRRLEQLIDLELKRNLARLRRRHQRKQARKRPSATTR